MNEYSTTNNEKAKIQSIRKQYLSKEENKIELLRELDRKVKMPGKIVAGIIGTGGALLLGAGMSNIMVWNAMRPGLTMGIPGLIIALLSYPIYTIITKSRKKKYADQIIKLSDDLIK